MSLGIFKVKIDKNTEDIFKNFIYSNKIKCCGYNSYKLNQDNVQHYTCIEKTIHKLADHNIQYMKNGNIEDFNVTFFTKCYKNEHSELNFHIDFDDIDLIKNKTETIRPVLSSITYLSKSTNPTMITNVTRNDIYEDNINIVDKDLCSLLYYPNKYDHIIFEGGKYYHGEILMENTGTMPFSNIDCTDEISDERIMIVTFLWKKEDLPIVPYFQKDLISYNIISRCGNIDKIDGFINNIIGKDVYENKDYKFEIKTKKVNIISYINNLLNYNFYIDSISKNEINFNNFNKICDYNIINKNTNNRNELSLQELNNIFFLSSKTVEINNIFDLKTQYISDYILDYNIFGQNLYNYILDVMWKNKSIYDIYPIYKIHNVDLQINDKLLEDNIDYIINGDGQYKFNSYILDVKQKLFSPLEKLVYDIAETTLKNISIPFDNDIKIEFSINTENDSFHLHSSDSNNEMGYNIYPFLSNIYYLNNGSDNDTYSYYTVVSSLTINDLKYNNSKDNDICFVSARKNKLLTFFGGKYYHGNIKNSHNKQKVLILKYWYKPHINTNVYYRNTYYTNLYEKNQHITNFNISRNYRIISLDNQKMRYFSKAILERNNNYEDYIELIKKIDNTCDVTLFTSTNMIKPLNSIKFTSNNDSNYIEEEFNRLSKDVETNCKSTVDLNNTIKLSDNTIKKSNIVSKERFDIYNYYIPFSMLHITDIYINSLESKFDRINDNNNTCLELDYNKHLDEDMQRFIFKNLLLSMLDHTKKNNIDIKYIKIRKNIVYRGYIDNNYIYLPLSNNIRITIESYQLDVLKGGFVDIKNKSHLSIYSKEILLCIEYI